MKKPLIISGLFLSAMLFSLFIIYQWFFCRFYVHPGYMAIITAQTGDAPPPNSILVERGQKGIWRDVLPEGRHFLNPMIYDWKIVHAIEIPLGKVGIVTAKIGAELPAGEIIAHDRHSKGVWRDVLSPGTYRLNPLGYDVRIVDAINIPIGYVGIVTSQTGKPAVAGEFAQMNEKGVWRDILQPGLYYINPLAYQVNVIEIGMNQVSMARHGDGANSLITTRNQIESADVAVGQMRINTLNSQLEQRLDTMSNSGSNTLSNTSAQQRSRSAPAPSAEKSDGKIDLAQREYEQQEATVRNVKEQLKRGKDKAVADVGAVNSAIFGVSRLVEFPSRDGFKIMIEMTVEFELMPEHIAKIYLLYGDLPQVVEKIIMPQVLSVSRIKGSTYKAQDFIMGEGRETFQNDLKKDLARVLMEKHVLVHNAIIRNVEIPDEILKPIRMASLSREQNLTNASLQETAKIEALLNTEVALIAQKKSEVAQETKKVVAEISANREKEIAKINAQTNLSVAELQLKKTEIVALINKIQGETIAQAEYLTNNEYAQGMIMRAQALGNPQALANLQFVENLNNKIDVKIIYAGDGTLWTDLKSAGLNITPPAPPPPAIPPVK